MVNKGLKHMLDEIKARGQWVIDLPPDNLDGIAWIALGWNTMHGSWSLTTKRFTKAPIVKQIGYQEALAVVRVYKEQYKQEFGD